MKSAFELSPQGVREVVPEDAVGFYRLGIIQNNEFWPRYIGRSDNSLEQRLLSHCYQRPWVTHYEPVITGTVKRAYDLECRAWHLHGDKLDNDIHPARPDDSAYECPYCDLEQEFKQSAYQTALGD